MAGAARTWLGGAVVSVLMAACAGSGPAPDAPAAPAPGGPPEGRGQSGIDYGAWRSRDPDARAKAFAAAVAQRFPVAIEAERLAGALALDGYQCRDGNRPEAQPVPTLECRLEAMDQGCAIDWVVSLWPDDPRPRASSDTFCLGAEAPRR